MIDGLTKENAGLSAQIEAFRPREASWQTQSQKIAAELADKEKAFSDLAAQKQDLEKKLKEYDEGMSQAKVERAVLESQLKDQKAREQFLQSQVAGLFIFMGDSCAQPSSVKNTVHLRGDLGEPLAIAALRFSGPPELGRGELQWLVTAKILGL